MTHELDEVSPSEILNQPNRADKGNGGGRNGPRATEEQMRLYCDRHGGKAIMRTSRGGSEKAIHLPEAGTDVEECVLFCEQGKRPKSANAVDYEAQIDGWGRQWCEYCRRDLRKVHDGGDYNE
jgi:hypothetical protein